MNEKYAKKMFKTNNHKPLTRISISTFELVIFGSIHQYETKALTASLLLQIFGGTYMFQRDSEWFSIISNTQILTDINLHRNCSFLAQYIFSYLDY